MITRIEYFQHKVKNQKKSILGTKWEYNEVVYKIIEYKLLGFIIIYKNKQCLDIKKSESYVKMKSKSYK